jgi:hypothetical protein
VQKIVVKPLANFIFSPSMEHFAALGAYMINYIRVLVVLVVFYSSLIS